MTVRAFFPDFFSQKMIFLEIFLEKNLLPDTSVHYKRKKMFNFKQISLHAAVFAVFAFFSSLFPGDAGAMGEKPSREALDYVQDLHEVRFPDVKPEIPIPETRLLAKCGEQLQTSPTTGVIVTDDGKIYGYKGTTPVKNFRPSVLLADNPDHVRKIIEYAKTIKLKDIHFTTAPEGATYCGIDYLADFETTSTRWAKHPYLREAAPPPQELLILFEAINNAALQKDPFADTLGEQPPVDK